MHGLAGGAPLTPGATAVARLFYQLSLNPSLLSSDLGLWFGMRPEQVGAVLRTVVGLVATETIRPQVGSMLPLAEASELHW